jgi:hypothetical protein
MIDAEDRGVLNRPSAGFGEWAAKRGITVLDVDTPNDWVHHTPIPGVEHHTDKYDYGDPLNDNVPRFPTVWDDFALPPFNQARKAWHEYTATHMSETSKRVLATAWR